MPKYRADPLPEKVRKIVSTPSEVAPGSAGGDKRDMRMVPIIGPGIESAIPFTRPDRQIVRLDKRG